MFERNPWGSDVFRKLVDTVEKMAKWIEATTKCFEDRMSRQDDRLRKIEDFIEKGGVFESDNTVTVEFTGESKRKLEEMAEYHQAGVEEISQGMVREMYELMGPGSRRSNGASVWEALADIQRGKKAR